MRKMAEILRHKHRMHPNSLANIEGRQFKKGHSGNPAGRPPKDLSLTSLLKVEIDKVPDFEAQKGGKRTWRQLLVEMWLQESYKGDRILFQSLLDRLEGRVPQAVIGEEGGPILIQLVPVQRAEES